MQGDLCDIVDLSGKLSKCTHHCHGLQNLYRNLSKREADLRVLGCARAFLEGPREDEG